MFGRLVQKELLNQLLDLRFVLVFALCILLTGVGVLVGVQNYQEQLEQYRAVSQSNREALRTSLKEGRLGDLYRFGGYRWNRRPQVLSPVVYGESGGLGREVRMQYRQWFPFEASLFATDPIHLLFGVLDMAFIVKIVLSLCMLLFTYDAVCGEKEGGTLRLCASFPLARSTIALAKIVGSTLAVLVPFLLAILLASTLLALYPDLGLDTDDWLRMLALLVLFGLYLMVFAGFGIWVSAMTYRRMTAFLALLGLWTVWVFVIPNVAVDVSRRIDPADSIYDMEKAFDTVRRDIRNDRIAEYREFKYETPPDVIESMNQLRKGRVSRTSKEYRQLIEQMTTARRKAYMPYRLTVDAKWDDAQYARMARIQEDRRNRIRRQRRLAAVLSAISPVGAATFASMDLARTSIIQHERLEDTLGRHLVYLAKYVRDHWPIDRPLASLGELTGFIPFAYQDSEAVWGVLSRNVLNYLNLVLLSILGFSGAYLAILKYDVR